YTTTFYAINCGSFLMSYPNPAKDVLTLGFSESTTEKLPNEVELFSEKTQKSVYKISGSSLDEGLTREKTLQISVKDLPRGTYFLHVTANGEDKKKEIVQIVLE